MWLTIRKKKQLWHYLEMKPLYCTSLIFRATDFFFLLNHEVEYYIIETLLFPCCVTQCPSMLSICEDREVWWLIPSTNIVPLRQFNLVETKWTNNSFTHNTSEWHFVVSDTPQIFCIVFISLGSWLVVLLWADRGYLKELDHLRILVFKSTTCFPKNMTWW